MSQESIEFLLPAGLSQEEFVAAIAAAATVFVKKRVAIRSIEPAKARASKWSRQGRTIHFSSHNTQTGRPGPR